MKMLFKMSDLSVGGFSARPRITGAPKLPPSSLTPSKPKFSVRPKMTGAPKISPSNPPLGKPISGTSSTKNPTSGTSPAGKPSKVVVDPAYTAPPLGKPVSGTSSTKKPGKSNKVIVDPSYNPPPKSSGPDGSVGSSKPILGDPKPSSPEAKPRKGVVLGDKERIGNGEFASKKTDGDVGHTLRNRAWEGMKKHKKPLAAAAGVTALGLAAKKIHDRSKEKKRRQAMGYQ